jgi:DNA-binding beta-propeller fold protein YncE
MKAAITAFILSLTTASLAVAQTSELYVNQVDGNQMVVLRGGNVIRSWNTAVVGENALAVAESIRTAGSRYQTNFGQGREYDLNGTLKGPTYQIVGGGNWFDGTTDGLKYNYAIQHNGSYYLYRFNREWSEPEALFHVGYASSGITYDPLNSTLWISDALSKTIKNVDLDNNVLSTFTAVGPQYAYGLALDPVDRTLWMGGYGSNRIYQFETNGRFLQSIAIPGFSSAYGMEFVAVPEPSSFVLLGFALGGTYIVRRRRA